MRAVVQRVRRGSVSVDGERIAQIGRGYVILLGVAPGDGDQQAAALARKIAMLRVFEDEQGKMNLSIKDVGGAALVVSQFTLYAERAKATVRPSPAQRCPIWRSRCWSGSSNISNHLASRCNRGSSARICWWKSKTTAR